MIGPEPFGRPGPRPGTLALLLLAAMIEIELLNTPNQRRVRFLAHDDLPERIGCDQHGIGASVDGARLYAVADLQRAVKALDDWTRCRWRCFG